MSRISWLALLPGLLLAQDRVAPTLSSKIDPAYTEEARRAHVEGIVVLSLTVDENGLPENIRVVRGLGYGLDEQAVQAVSQWRFVAGRKKGVPVKTPSTIEVSFRLPIELKRIRVSLWPKVEAKPEVVVQRGKDGLDNRAVSNIHNPSIEVFLPPAAARNGAAIVIAPGGGHRYLAIDHEGYNVAGWLHGLGVTPMILRYRLAKEEGSTYTVEQAAEDGRRAIRTARAHAKEWGLDPNRVGIMGFSAGGDVAARAGTSYAGGDPGAADPIERCSSRPDFMVLMYPGLAQTPVPVDANTPPTFISFAGNDSPAIVESATQLFLSLRKAGVPVEMHVYARGGHGFGIKPANRDLTATWTARLADWMGESGWLKKQ